MASLSDVHKCITKMLPDYKIDVQEDFENAAISLSIKNGSVVHILKVSDDYVEGIASADFESDLIKSNFITRMVNAGSHPLLLNEEGLRYLS